MSQPLPKNDLLRATIADAMTAIATILAMSFGVVAPKMIIERFDDAYSVRDLLVSVSLPMQMASLERGADKDAIAIYLVG